MTSLSAKKCVRVIPFLFLAACSRWGTSGLFSNGKMSVSVEKVLSEEKLSTLSLPATLSPSEKVDIAFPMDVKIDRVSVNAGDTVNAGDPLFVLSDQDFNLRLGQLKAQRMEQEALLEKNNYFLKNRDRLLEEGKIDKTTHDALETEVKTTETLVERLKADIALTENQTKQLAVNAPIAGLVTAKNIAGGVSVPARAAMLTIVKADPVNVVFHLPEAQAGAVEKGMNVSVKIENFPDQNFTAQVSYLSPELDQAGHTLEVRATLPNPKQTFKGGMNAEVYFVSPQKSKVLSIPTKAVLSDSGKDYVYIVRQNRAWRVRVYTRKNLDKPELTEIMEGLAEGDMVVTENQDKLKEGMEVNLWR